MMILAGPYTEAEADARSRAAMRAIVRARGGTWIDGQGEPPGEQQGPGPRNLPHQGYATHAVPLLPAVADGQSYIEVTAGMQSLPSGTETVNGQSVPVTRSGADIDPSDVLREAPA